jgi:glycine hydroxymethyltransferase
MIMTRENPDIEKKIASRVFPGSQGGPLMHVIAAKAVALKEALEPGFKAYQEQTIANARKLAATMMERGYNIVSGGTDNHLFLLDLIEKGITGKDVEAALGKANITVNKNAVPNDPQSPFITSGIRVGTPAVTTRGFTEPEIEKLGNWMCDVIENMDDETTRQRVKNEVLEVCARFPVYP